MHVYSIWKTTDIFTKWLQKDAYALQNKKKKSHIIITKHNASENEAKQMDIRHISN